MALCLALALISPPDLAPADAAPRAAEPVAYKMKLAPAETRAASWSKLARDFDGLEIARALGALSDSKRIVAAFEDMGYRLDLLRDGVGTVPRVYLKTLPVDLGEIDSSDLRKVLFIKTVLPLVLRVNEELLAKRANLEGYAARLRDGETLSTDEQAALVETADLYGVKPGEPAAMLRELMRRVDAIPPSLALTQAALESGWGTSRFAQEGNALFGQKAFDDSVTSILSRHTNPSQAQRMRSFEDLTSAVRSYAHNLNSHPAYSEFRAQRAEMRRKSADGALDGEALARTLLRYSERGLGYTADLRQMIRSNGMKLYDAARLEGAAPATQLASADPSGA